MSTQETMIRIIAMKDDFQKGKKIEFHYDVTEEELSIYVSSPELEESIYMHFGTIDIHDLLSWFSEFVRLPGEEE